MRHSTRSNRSQVLINTRGRSSFKRTCTLYNYLLTNENLRASFNAFYLKEERLLIFVVPSKPIGVCRRLLLASGTGFARERMTKTGIDKSGIDKTAKWISRRNSTAQSALWVGTVGTVGNGTNLI